MGGLCGTVVTKIENSSRKISKTIGLRRNAIYNVAQEMKYSVIVILFNFSLWDNVVGEHCYYNDLNIGTGLGN